MEKKQPDYGQPLVFLGLLIFLSIVSYYVEKYLGINSVIIFVIWAILTMKVFMWISKKGLSYGSPASFFALALTFTFVGFYVGHTLNIETFIWLVLWTSATLVTWVWIKNNTQADKRLFHLLSMQSIALAIMIPILLHYANQTLTAHQPTQVSQHTEHAVVNAEKHLDAHHAPSMQTHVKSEQDVQLTAEANHHFNQLLLSTLQRLIFVFSILVAVSAWRVGRRQTLEVT
jgi:hypothetical protein